MKKISTLLSLMGLIFLCQSFKANAQLSVYNVTGGGNICAGDPGSDIGLDNSDVGVNYQLFDGSSLVGSLIAGTGGAIDFGYWATAGTYTVIADPGDPDETTMSGSATMAVNPLPSDYPISSGGDYCSGGSGVDLTLSGSDGGVNYQLFYNGSPVGSAVAGTWSGLDLGYQTGSGSYTVVATDGSTGCFATMSGSATVTIDPLPNVYNISSGGNYCSGGSGVDITLDNSDAGIDYQLYFAGSPIGSAMSGTGSPLDFGNQTGAGSYTIVATDVTYGCVNNMSGTATVGIDPLPNVYSVSGGGNYCSGGSGVNVSLSNSDAGVNYQLYNGSNVMGSAVAGTGSSIDFGFQTASGSYTAVATDATTGCVSDMSGSASVTIDALPTAYSLTGGGSICGGSPAGYNVGLGNSDAGVNYQLYIDGTPSGLPVAGVGSAFDFGFMSSTGTYTVVATDATTFCTSNMAGSATILSGPVPTAYSIGGGGAYCAGGTGVDVTLSGSDAGVTYQLYDDANPVGSAMPGTGSSLDFGLQTGAGAYTVVATDNTAACSNTMTGSASIVVNPLPTAYPMTGGGGACATSISYDVALGGSSTGIDYQLYLDGAPFGSSVSGTGSVIDFGIMSATGTYTVIGTDAITSCTNTMAGSSVVTVNPLPTAYSTVGGGSFCAGGAGVDVALMNSDGGITYTLYNGATPVASLPGGGYLDFGLQTTGGSYGVAAMNMATGCGNTMTGTVTVLVNPQPTAYTVSGGGSYCAGSGGADVYLNSSTIGVNYQLYKGTSTVGGFVPGTGAPLDFGLKTDAGTYTIIATDGTTSCTGNMAGNTIISATPLPTAYSVTGGGNYCAGGTGVDIGLENTDAGVNYQLYLNGVATGMPLVGTGAAKDFGDMTAGGVYTILGTDATTTCAGNMSGNATVTVISLPTAFDVAGGGDYCSGGVGATVGLSGSTTGVSYQLYDDASQVGSPFPGDGSAINFGDQTAAGNYTVVATDGNGCVNNMSGSVDVIIDPLPNIYSITGGGSYCAGDPGVSVGLANSDAGNNYYLYNGSSIVSATAGTGAAIDFGPQMAGGTYTVSATNTANGCVAAMSGSTVITVNPLPGLYNVTGGGNYCPGGNGVDVNLSGSAAGISYQLFNGVSPVGLPVNGGPGAIDFGLQTTAGSYSVVATNTGTSCTRNMTGSVSVNVYPAAITFNVTGGGAYCAGGAGVAIGLDGSQAGLNYQLYNGSAVGSAIAGTGAAIDFGANAADGSYTVTATDPASGCITNMAGASIVSTNPLPNDYSVTGGGNYCTGDAGKDVSLSGSDAGVSYQMYNGALAIGSAMAGTGGALDLGFQTSGTYLVVATDATSGCKQNMSGAANIVADPLPAAFVLTGGGSYCTGAGGLNIGLSRSVSGTSYQLYNGSSPVGAIIAGTGGALSFGTYTSMGTYTVVANDPATTCSNVMTGSATIGISPLPVSYSMTGGGHYCVGDAGRNIGLGGSDVGIRYELFKGTASTGLTITGTGSALNFGVFASTGIYRVVATDIITGCVNNMAGVSAIAIDPLPAANVVTGGGNFCPGASGMTVGLSMSDAGVLYQLFNGPTIVGSPVPGTGVSLDFGTQSIPGTYTVTALDAATGCANIMTGSATIAFNALPGVYNMTGGGDFCPGGAGVHVGVSGSNVGDLYELYNGSVLVGSPYMGTGSSIDFGLQTTTGSYGVVAKGLTTGCVSNMAGAAIVALTPLPAVQVVTGGGDFCVGSAGVHIGLAGSQTGVYYQLYNGAALVGSPMAGTGTGVDFGLQTIAGSYSVIASNIFGACTNLMSGSANVNIAALPAVYAVTGGGSFCAGGSGVSIALSSSSGGVSYQLYNGTIAVGSSVAGTGSSIDFGSINIPGTYQVKATDATSSCATMMTGSAVVSATPAPVSYTVTGGGSYCSGTSGVHILLSNSTFGVSYQLLNGSIPVGSATGTGRSIDFSGIVLPGSYKITATDATGCTSTMTGSPSVAINPLPATHSVTGGGNYCAGGTGADVALTASDAGVQYQLYVAGRSVGAPVNGTGGVIDFGNMTSAGTYTVIARNTATSCTSAMTGSAAIGINPLPSTYAVTGGGSFCAGGAGVHVGLSSSAFGTSYQLLLTGSAVGSPVPGTGSTIDFGLQTGGGTYTVVAKNTASGCISTMAGAENVVVNTLPPTYSVTGGGNYCAGGTGVVIGMSASNAGVDYQLLKGTSPVGSPVSGSGGTIDFGLQTGVGSYNVVATNTTTGCSNNMSGSVTIGTNALPATYPVTGGGAFCSGGTGVHVGMVNSAAGVSYQLFNGTSTDGMALTGTGAALDFGAKTVAGAYTVVATDAITGCTNRMPGTANITVGALPTVYNVTGGGNYCHGGTGVHVGLGNSNTGIIYTLYSSGSAVSTLPGTGTAIDFGLQTAAVTYTVVAMDAITGCNSAMSGSAAIMINPSVIPAVSISSGGRDTVCDGTMVNFTASAINTGATPVYNWSVNGVTVSPGASYSYIPLNGDIVQVSLASSENCATPAVVTAVKTMAVMPNELPAVNVAVSPAAEVCEGTTVTFTATPFNGGSSPVYAWMKNGVNVGYASTYSYLPASGDNVYCVMTSDYRCRVADDATSSNTRMTVVVPVIPTVTISADPGTNVSPGQLVYLTANVVNGGVAPVYQWLLNGAAIAGANTANYSTTSYSDNDQFSVNVTSNGVCTGNTGSGSVTIHVSNVGVKTIAAALSDIKIIPNPSNGLFAIKGSIGNGVDHISVEISDMMGRAVYSNITDVHNGMIDTTVKLNSDLSNGMYILSIRSENEASVYHLAIER